VLKPPRLRAGARIALIAPAGPVAESRLTAALQQCEQLGLEPRLGRSAHMRIGYLAGSDAARLADLQAAIASDEIDAIWALRGGYGTMRLLPSLDLGVLAERPKAFIGFSDNTALHLAYARNGLVSFHAPHAGAAMPAMTAACFQRVLFEAAPAGLLPEGTETQPRTLVSGVAEAPLIGGNLAMLAACCGTPCALRAEGRILVLEEVGEAAYRVDRMITQLLLAGALDGVQGIAIGQFTGWEPEPIEPSLDELFLERFEPLGVPVLAGLPFGHVDENWSLPFGVHARLDANNGTLTILENAVT
jgi:muramoyltetrapeptide carboxypeptidase